MVVNGDLLVRRQFIDPGVPLAGEAGIGDRHVRSRPHFARVSCHPVAP
jgi:hypothetical protein